MKPILQTIMESGKGNCLAACIASILEVQIDEIPDLKCGGDQKALKEYLATKGISPIWLHCKDLTKSYVGYTPEYCIVVGKSPRLEAANHAVVGKPNGYGYKVVHDPHPEGKGLNSISSVIYFGKLFF